MDISKKIVLAHKGFYDFYSKKKYIENSKEVCAISTKKDYIKIIELDLRKSKDGILYCYHGNLFEYYIHLKIPKTFSEIKKKINVDSLSEILDVITEDKSIFLDIKDNSITKEDIIKVFNNKYFKEVIMGNKYVSYLNRFSNMPNNFTKILNGNIFCNFYNLQKLKTNNFSYFEVVFPFQISKKVISNVEKAGLNFRCAGLFFLTKKSYINKIEKFGIKHISSDYI